LGFLDLSHLKRILTVIPLVSVLPLLNINAEDNLELIFTITVPAESVEIVSVTPVGDYNADGYGDLLIGVHRGFPDILEVAYLYYGGPVFDLIPDLTFYGNPQDLNICDGPELSHTGFGRSALGLGDFNGDDFDDFAVAASGLCYNEFRNGRIYIYFGSPNPDTSADLTFEGELIYDQVGAELIAGNFNGDGYGDFLTCTGNPSFGEKIYIFLGSDPPDCQFDWIYDYSLTTIEVSPFTGGYDINDDSYDDFSWVISGDNMWGSLLFWGGDPISMTPADTVDQSILNFRDDISGDEIDDFLLWTPGFYYLCLGGEPFNVIPDYTLPHTFFDNSFIYMLPDGEKKFITDVPHLMKLESYNTGVPFDTIPYDIYNYNFHHGSGQINIGDINADGIEDLALSDSSGPNLYIYSIIQTMIADGDRNIKLPENLESLSCYPNPFNSATIIYYNGGKDVNKPTIKAMIYNIAGEFVNDLTLAKGGGGKYTGIWDATAANNEEISAGIYFVKIPSSVKIASKVTYLK
jgi:hypothetical protein